MVPTDDDGRVEAVPREVRRARADEPHQRGRLRRSSAARDRADRRRPGGLLRARGVPGAGRQRALRLSRPRGTGSTSGRPSATSRPPTTCSPARVGSARCPTADETGSLIGDGLHHERRAHRPADGARRATAAVGTDTTVERSVLHDGVIVGADCVVQRRDRRARASAWGRARGSSRARVLGSAAEVAEGAWSRGRRARAARGEGRMSASCRARRRGRRSEGIIGDVVAPAHQLARCALAGRGGGAAAGRRSPAAWSSAEWAARRSAAIWRRRPSATAPPRPLRDASAATRRGPGSARTRSCCARATPATPRRRSRASRRRAPPARARVALTTGGELAERRA